MYLTLNSVATNLRVDGTMREDILKWHIKLAHIVLAETVLVPAYYLE